MPDKMSWKECVEKRIITKITPDKERANKMLKMANIRLEFWSKEVDSRFVSLKVEAYYDIIKELIFTHMYKTGFNCTNHLCIIAYLKEKFQEFDFEIQKIDELRRIRNEINYRGFFVSTDYLERNKLEFKNIIKKLKEKINER
nr:hypothetical protein [Nanoarchaeota archaeon]